ncbi:MAG: STT3 domain-containing protein [Caldimicrobium thiodismutans]
MKKENFYYEIFYFILFLIVLSFGVYIRFDDQKVWKENEALFFYKGEPLYSEYDSFYFARYALDMREGLFKSGTIDNFRFFPDNSSQAKLSDKESFAPKYSLSGNFISYLFYKLSTITGLSVAWLTYYLIPFLAVTIAVVLYLYFHYLKMPFCGILGGLITVSSPMYLGRTGLMRLDHDVLNLTLPFLTAYFFLRFFRTQKDRARYFWIILSSLTLNFYYLWYAHANLNFVLVLTFLLAYLWDPLKAFIFKREVTYKFTRKDYFFLAILVLPQIWYLYIGPYHLYEQVKTLVFNIKSLTAAERLFKDFPNIFMSISELQKLSFWEVITAVVYNRILGVIGLISVFFMFIFHFRSLLFLFPFFVIGLLTFFSGARFAMYLSPFIGIGLGYLVYLLFEKLFLAIGFFKEEKKQKILIPFVGFLLFITTLYIQSEALRILSTPKILAPLVKDMEWIKEKTPKNAVVWSWWDYGYAFQLYARRATFHDGGSQGSPKTYMIARSFATSDPKEAWLITSFVANYGLTGLAKLLKEGHTAKEVMENIRNGLYQKPIKTPIYWVFTADLIDKFGWIHYFGTYDFDKKEGIFGKIFVPQCKFISTNLIQCPQLNNTILDLNEGLIRIANEYIPIKYLYYSDGKTIQSKKFFDQGIYTVEIVKTPNNQTGLFILESPSEATLFNEMFILRKYDPRFFELVYDDFPHMVVYKVKSE